MTPDPELVDTSFSLSSRVRLHGLELKPHLDGLIGTIAAVSADRFGFPIDGFNAAFAVKVINLRRVDDHVDPCVFSLDAASCVRPHHPQGDT